MKHRHGNGLRRRDFLGAVVSGSAAVGLALAPRPLRAAGGSRLSAGEGVVDITPPLGIEMGGFHRAPGKERRIVAIRQPSAVRALVLQHGDVQVAICSLDIACFAADVSARIQAEVARQTGIPAANVRVCATHTHSMPSFCYLRQWGAIPRPFMATVEQKTVEAVRLAKADLAPAELSLGQTRVVGGNHNRTTKAFKKDDQFGKDSNDNERWLDTLLQALLFERAGGKRSLLWYHFSAHAVCYADEQAGPDWPGEVAELVAKNQKLSPSFLQGHCGDVNPGDGVNWRGEIKQTVNAIYPALCQAISNVKRLKVNTLRSQTTQFSLPLDKALHKSWVERYQKQPDQCVRGEWVDAGFAKDWFEGNAKRDLGDGHVPISLSALQLGDVGMVFHPSELYSCFGLTIRRDSPLANTLVVGYTDGIIGYLPDPNAYKANEYSAIVVPKILDVGPFTPTGGEEVTAAASALLKKTVG